MPIEKCSEKEVPRCIIIPQIGKSKKIERKTTATGSCDRKGWEWLNRHRVLSGENILKLTTVVYG